MKQALTVKEAALVTGRAQRTIYHWIETGVLDYESRYINAKQLFAVEAQMTMRRGRPRKAAKDAKGI